MTRTRRLVVGIAGGPGANHGLRLLELLAPTAIETHLVIASSAGRAIENDTGGSVEQLSSLADHTYRDHNQAARISSGSFPAVGMVVVACTDATLAALATGYAETLLHRAADVAMKEGRPLTILGRGLDSSARGADHVRLLRDVPGVEVRNVADHVDVDATLLYVLERFHVGPILAARP
jgi:polyprenyl P-hydroxybenzoate/phenylacrylic acid decarboxylase-like protein